MVSHVLYTLSDLLTEGNAWQLPANVKILRSRAKLVTMLTLTLQNVDYFT